MTIRIRENPQLVALARTRLREHPTLPRDVEQYAKARGIPPETAWTHVEDAAFDALDRTATRYASRMAGLVEHMTTVRGEVHGIYERMLSGQIDPSSPAALRSLLAQLHEDMNGLTDPQTWLKQERHRWDADPRTGRYPGPRPELLGGPSNAPLPGTPVAGTGTTWKRQVVEMTRAWDPARQRWSWKFPDLPEGVVLEFEAGYRVWKHPGGAIEEEIVVGPSQSRYRGQTRGEEAIRSARDMGPEELSAAMHRAHGAGAPGLGGDFSFGVALAPQEINLRFENAGVERWVRQLRDNAPDGVDYLYRTTTSTRNDTLLTRTYRISAVLGDRVHDLYEFTISMKPGGLRNEDVVFELDTFRPFADAERFTAPKDVASSASEAYRATEAGREPGFASAVEPPDVLREALGRLAESRPDVVNPALSRASSRLGRLRETVNGKLLAGAGEDVRRYQVLDRMDQALEAVAGSLDADPVDEARLTALGDALERFNQRAARWPDHVTDAQIREFARELRELLEANP